MKNSKLGMIFMVTIISTSIASPMAFAAPGGKPATVRELMTEYSKQIKKSAFGGASSAKGLNAQAIKAAQDKMINELKLPASKANSLSIAIRSNPAGSQAKLEALATIVAAKKLATELQRTDAQQAKSLSEAADVSISFLSNSYLTGARKESSTLTQQEMTQTTEALKRLENVTELLLTRFQSVERASYVKILAKHDSLIASGKKTSSEEALVDAIMQEKGLSKEKAMELVRKLKDCV